jgi:anaerobic magnesium-protoporphyrin IX monomethyl ester cyclase
MLKILLIRPDKIESHFHMTKSTKRIGDLHQPLGLLYIATVLRNDGVDVKISDEIVGDDSLYSFNEFKPDLVGITVTTPLFERAKVLTKIFQEMGSKVLLGGPHISSVPDDSIRESGADAVIIGEGEFTACELCKEKDWNKVDGIIFKYNGNFKKTSPRKLIENLDSIPIPDRSFLDLSKYKNDEEFGFPIKGNDVLMRLFTSRGCPFPCTFCCSFKLFGRKVRFRSAENIFKEIEYLTKGFKTRHVMFMDDTFTLKEDIVQELCNKFISMKLDLRWACFARVGLKPETLKIMRSSGCQLIGYGVESGSQKVLKNVKKNTTPEQIMDSFKNTRNAGIDSKAFMIVGLPGEDETEFRISVDFAKKLNPPFMWLSIFYPLPGTEAYELVKNQGKLSDSNKVSYFQSDDSVLLKRHRQFLKEFYFRLSYLTNLFRNFSIERIIYFTKMFFMAKSSGNFKDDKTVKDAH